MALQVSKIGVQSIPVCILSKRQTLCALPFKASQGLGFCEEDCVLHHVAALQHLLLATNASFVSISDAVPQGQAYMFIVRMCVCVCGLDDQPDSASISCHALSLGLNVKKFSRSVPDGGDLYVRSVSSNSSNTQIQMQVRL